MSDSFDDKHKLSQESQPVSSHQTICHDCAFSIKLEQAINCIHPEEFEPNCAKVLFCNSFQPAQEIDSPCVTFGQDDVE